MTIEFFVARLSIPTPFEDLRKKYSVEDWFPYVSDYKAIDGKGRYLHWNDLKRRVPKDKSSECAWIATKYARSTISKRFSILNNPNVKIEFCVPDSLQALLHQVDKVAGGNISSNDSSILNKRTQQKYLVSSLLMEEAITSSQLEGAVTTRKVAKEMLTTERAPKNKSEKMILNNYRLMRAAVENKDASLSVDLILNFHEIATKDAIENDAVSGEFRDTNDIHVKDQDEEIVHYPPNYELINEYMVNLCDFTNINHNDNTTDSFIHPVVKAIILHYLIGYIHPFGDGNGRTARALFYWFMLKSGYWLFEYVSISRLLKEAPIKYGISYLKCETDDNDVTYFIYDQIQLIVRAINELIEHINRKQKEYYDFMLLFEDSKVSHRLSHRQKEILKKAAKNPGKIFTVKEIQNKYGVSTNTARTDLQKLADCQFLVESKNGRASLYIAHAGILDQLRKDS